MTTHTTWNAATDNELVKQLTESMIANGWIGAPLVSWGEYLITGSHRHVAALALGIEVPIIELEDVFAEAGIDFAECHAAAGYPTIDEISESGMFEQLPESIIEKYGIQWE